MPHSLGTVRNIITHDGRLTWRCQQCGAWGEADIQRIRAAKGDDFDLMDRSPPCRAEGCTYWLTFYVQHGMRTNRLTTRQGDDRDGDRRTAWLKLKWAAERRKPDAG